MKFIVRLLFPLLLLGFLFSQARVDGLVALVGNNIILHSDVLQQAQIIATSQRINPEKKPYLFEKIYSDALYNMVNQYVVLDVAEKDTNLIISDDEVDRALERRIDDFIIQAGSKELFEQAVGMSLRQIKSDYWREIRNMMLIERYKFSTIQAVNVGRVEVNSFYNNFKDSIPALPENYTFSVIEVPFVSGASSEILVYNSLDSLRNLIVGSGASFDSMAIIYSQDPGSAPSGGNLGLTSRGTLVQEYEEAAYALNPGELSLPIRSQFGYHLIRLIDKRGEKISSQHILLFVPFSNEDKKTTFLSTSELYQQANNDPFVFDSIAVEYNNLYNNFSGVYSNVIHSNIPALLLDQLNKQVLFKLSLPIEMASGYALIYLYKHDESYIPDPNNSWNIIYQYALQQKQDLLFQSHVNKIKNKTFIKIY